MSNITLTRYATQSIIRTHLTSVKNSFEPSLDTYVNIEEYSKKIANLATIWGEFDMEEVLIGMVAAYDNNPDRVGWITNVSVDPKHTGRGIASKLLDECVAFFNQKGYIKVMLEVNASNKAAIALYTKHNFKIDNMKDKTLTLTRSLNSRDYNNELKDTADHKYVYNFDFDVMHPYMIKAFEPHFVQGSCLELGSFKGDFTKRLLPYFDYITCVEASSEAINEAQDKIRNDIRWVEGRFEDIKLPTKYDNIIITHVLEHIENPVKLLKRIKDEWLSDKGNLFIVVPNANAPSRQIAVKMGLIEHNTSITPSEKEHGHNITYTLDVLESHAKKAGLDVTTRSGIFFKALANFQWDQLLQTDIISKEYLDGCYDLGQQYPDLCSSIMLICKKG